MRKIRVGWIVERTEKYQNYLKILYLELNKLEHLNIRIDSYTKGDWEVGEYVFPSYKIRRLISMFYFEKNKTFEITRWLKNYDIIHVQDSFLFSKLLSMIDVAKRPKIIVTLKGGDTYIKPWINKSWHHYYNLDSEYNLIDKFVVLSQNQADYLIQNWKVDSKKVVVSGLSSEVPVASVGRALLNKKKIKIVSVFRLVWEKNIFQSLLFIKKLKDFNINIEYHVLGHGPEMGQLMYLINRLNLSDIVIAHGYCEPKTVAAELESSDFILQLSISEALSVSLLEAQSIGLIPIVFSTGGIPEAVTQNGISSALMSELGDVDSLVEQFLEIIKNPDNYRVKSETALEVVRTKFTIKHEADRITSVYNSLYD